MLADTSNRITRMSENPLSLRANFCRTNVRKLLLAKKLFLHGMLYPFI